MNQVQYILTVLEIMDTLPNDLYHKIMKIYFTQSVMKEYMSNVEYIKPQMYSNRRKIMIAERGAFTGKVFACKNCEDFGFPCEPCNKCVFRVNKEQIAYMYTVMQNPSNSVSPFRYAYIEHLKK